MSTGNLPPQMLSFSKKDKSWRKQHLDWADKRTYFFGNTIRNSLIKKRINYNLINGMLDMRDVELILNPDSINALYVPDAVQHFPIMNSKLHVLQGEESRRRFDFRVIVSNPNSISEVENNKMEALKATINTMIQDEGMSEDQFAAELEKTAYYYDYQ